MSKTGDCPHKSFFANVNVARITSDGTDDGEVKSFYADVTIKCIDCETPFSFVGVPAGLSPNQPMCDPFGLELRAPIKPGPLAVPLTRSVYHMPPEADAVSDLEQ